MSEPEGDFEFVREDGSYIDFGDDDDPVASPGGFEGMDGW